MVYWADTGEAIYNRNIKNYCYEFKCYICNPFVTYVCNEMRLKDWSLDPAVGATVKRYNFKLSETLSTKQYITTLILI